MIKKILLQEYGPFRRAEFDLAPLTVLVGPNASGKSTAMEALLRVREVLDAVDELFYHALTRFFESFRRIEATDKSFVAFDLDSSFFVFSEWAGGGPPPIADAQEAGPESLPPIRLLKFEPASLRNPSYLDADELCIQQNGYGLATVLADMKLQDDERLEWIQRQVRTIIPSFERARFKRAQVSREAEKVTGQKLIFDMKDAPGLSPDVVSDGTILVLGIVTSIAAMTRDRQSDAPALILIDDLERGLHPKALHEFVGCLRRMTEEMKVQILATSHSPYLLDSLKPEEVRLTGFLEDGTATICELSDHPDFERWKDVMTPGEFWSTAGEDWVRDVRK